MASTSEIKNGLCIDYDNDIYKVVEFLHVKPGKGPAFVRTKIKSLTTGKVLDNTWPAGHKIFPVRIERRKFQFLYSDESGYHFMNEETYDQVTIQEEMMDQPKLIKEGEKVEMLYHSEKEIPLTIELPKYVDLRVEYTEPGLKGDTATNANKPARLETGAEVRVPLFINEGDLVRVETTSGSYHERVKE